MTQSGLTAYKLFAHMSHGLKELVFNTNRLSSSSLGWGVGADALTAQRDSMAR